MPFFKALGGASQLLSTGVNIYTNKIDSGKDIARLQMRGNAWNVDDLVAAITAIDPIGAVADQLSEYWNGEENVMLQKMLNGVFTTESALSDPLILDISGRDGDASLLSKESILEAAQMLGKNKGLLTALCMHSAGDTTLNMRYGGTTYIPASGTATLPTISGRGIVMDDTMDYNPTTKVGTVYLFAKGAVGRGEGMPKNPLEYARAPSTNGGQDMIYSRRHFILHPRGWKWTENSVSKDTPSNAELALAANWERVYNRENLRIVKMIAKFDVPTAPVSVTTPENP